MRLLGAFFSTVSWIDIGCRSVPPSMNLMVDRGSGACSISAMALSVVGVTVAPRVGPLKVPGPNQLFY